jgi:hypothetical protein
VKHNTHIYIASKAIEFLHDSVDNMRTPGGTAAEIATRAKIKQKAVDLQRLLRSHQEAIVEASWAPDDVLGDKSIFHNFKLFTDQEFPDAPRFAAETHERNNKKYYRVKGGGGLAYKVDHLARLISDLTKLRAHNDHFKQEQIIYLYLMISHYVIDAHVPMHCDIRDNPPSDNDTTKPRPKERYYANSLHEQIEDLWEKACTPAALAECGLVANTPDDYYQETNLTPLVRFSLKEKNDVDLIKPYAIPDMGLMDFMIDICVQAKERSLKLFPINNPSQYNQAALPALTREIFADAIGDLITVYLWMWGE